MQKYEVSREIYNPCAGIYNFDMNFEEEVCTDNIEEVLEKWIGKRLPEFNKIITIIEKFSWKIDFFWIKKDFLTNIIYNKYSDLNKSNEEKSK